MRFWDLSGAEVEAADAAPWAGPAAGAMRPFSVRAIVRLSLAAALLYALTTLAGVVVWLTARSDVAHPRPWLASHLTVACLSCFLVVYLLLGSPRLVRRATPALGLGLLVATPFLVSFALVTGGPRFGVFAAAYIAAPLFAFYMLRPRWALLVGALVPVDLALLLWLQEGWESPLGMWLVVTANVVGTAVVVGLIAARADELAASEHEARVELADLNATLEERVEEQVAEIERLGGLRRFLSPQVADAVLSGESEQLTQPHRRRIAVFFCDLRGFTAFTNAAEPEEVIGVLDEYYHAVGGLLQRYDATIGDYAGDGVMAYFGDPVPCHDSAMVAVEMAHEVRPVMAGVVAEWQRRGYDLDYGIGLAYGYATLGVVGFDGRYDYKPVGGVVNLAARLCARAGSGQVLLDHPTHAATSERFASAHFADLDLKGYWSAMRAYALVA